ncbi:MAG: hypothetical protein JW892_13700 [Anaerolineae bacterium]|nr:hypothetical protein [Anaerolineae bacterium]
MGENLRRPYGMQEKIDFCDGAKPHHKNQSKRRHLHANHLAFAPKLKRTRVGGAIQVR